MGAFPDDIFTEPSDVDPDTLANLGPLRAMAGVWEGRKGVDLNPKADGPERREYIERIELQPIDPQANGPQLFYGLRYHIHINTVEEDATFHDQVGYWLWEPATGLVLQTVAIPRAGRWPSPPGRRRPTPPSSCCTPSAARPNTASARPPSWNGPSAPTATASRSPWAPTAAGATSPTPRCR